jgi:hypothetical protein
MFVSRRHSLQIFSKWLYLSWNRVSVDWFLRSQMVKYFRIRTYTKWCVYSYICHLVMPTFAQRMATLSIDSKRPSWASSSLLGSMAETKMRKKKRKTRVSRPKTKILKSVKEFCKPTFVCQLQPLCAHCNMNSPTIATNNTTIPPNLSSYKRTLQSYLRSEMF